MRWAAELVLVGDAWPKVVDLTFSTHSEERRCSSGRSDAFRPSIDVYLCQLLKRTRRFIHPDADVLGNTHASHRRERDAPAVRTRPILKTQWAFGVHV
jgi:hypothetical protein